MVDVRQIRQTDSEAVRTLDSRIQGDDRSLTWDTYVEGLLSIIELDWLQYPPWGYFVAEDEPGLVGFLLSERQTTAYGLPPGARIVAMAVDPSKIRLVAKGSIRSTRCCWLKIVETRVFWNPQASTLPI